MDGQPNDNQAQSSVAKPSEPLEYEETPVIEAVAESPAPGATDETRPPSEPTPEPPAAAPASKPPPPIKQGPSLPGLLGNIVLFIILFGAGVGLSMFLRQYVPSGVPSSPTGNRPLTPALVPTLAPETSTDFYATWKMYPVVSGVTKQPIAGISFKLPPDIPGPICDGGNCASQGTYLPGGTRFTVAPRGVGQLLSDYRGRIVSDLAGQTFDVRAASVSGRPAVEFSGLFTGTTNGGYAFSQMHGYMVQITDTLSLEINHFTPSGVTADFAADDSLFDKIVSTLSFGLSSSKGATLPTPQSPSPSTAPR